MRSSNISRFLRSRGHSNPHARLSVLLTVVLTPFAMAQNTIQRHTIDGGGGTSTGGTYTLSGTIGQHDAAPATVGTPSLVGGFWSRTFETVLQGYAAWAAENIDGGQHAGFDEDANGNGIPNGIEYIFGPEGVKILGPGVVTAPPQPIPADVDLVLRRSTDLVAWVDLLSYLEGEFEFQLNSLRTDPGGETFTDLTNDPKAFYQYEATHHP